MTSHMYKNIIRLNRCFKCLDIKMYMKKKLQPNDRVYCANSMYTFWEWWLYVCMIKDLQSIYITFPAMTFQQHKFNFGQFSTKLIIFNNVWAEICAHSYELQSCTCYNFRYLQSYWPNFLNWFHSWNSCFSSGLGSDAI